MATKPARASMITSRKTVPVSSSSWSSPSMALSQVDDRREQGDRAALQEAVIDHEPDVEHGADEVV